MKVTYLLFMRRPLFRRRDFHSGFRTELGNLIGDEQAATDANRPVKGKGTRTQSEAESTNAPLRLRLLHSSDEGPVMGLERREQTIKLRYGPTGNRRSLTNAVRQPCLSDGKSPVNREVQARICEGLGVKFPGPTRYGE